MQTKRLVVSLVALAAVIWAGTATAAPSPTKHVFSNKKEFKAAVAQHKVTNKAKTMTDDEKAKREEQFQLEMNMISKLDVQELEKVAAKHGVLIMNPNLEQRAVPQSIRDNVTIDQPIEAFDMSTYRTMFNGNIKWNSCDPLLSDIGWRTGNMGGEDVAGLMFTKVSRYSSLVGKNLYTYDSNSNWTNTYTNLVAGAYATDGRLAVLLAGNDRWLGTALGCYSWYRMAAWATFEAGWSDTGDVYTTYGHSWNTTTFSGFSWSLTAGTKSDSLAASGTLNWSESTSHWATDSLAYWY